MEKRISTIADRFVAHKYGADELYLERPHMEALQRKVRSAARFVFDDAAAKRVAEVVRAIPELLVREHAFARAPYELTWLELPHGVYWRALGHDPSGQDGSADHTVGYLIDHGEITVITGGTIANPMMVPKVTVLKYHLNTAWPEHAQEAFARIGDVSHETIDQFMWGSTWYALDAVTRTALRANNAISVLPVTRSPGADRTRRNLQAAISGGGGDLRTVIILLLLLNRPNLTRYANSPPSRGFVRGRVIPYMSHTSVRIDLDAVPVMRALGTPAGDGVARRRHEVRGHYCHDETARDYARIAGCAHDWRAADDRWRPVAERLPDVDHWVCDACEGHRWWREEHTRGDSTVGFVSHDDYTVTTR